MCEKGVSKTANKRCSEKKAGLEFSTPVISILKKLRTMPSKKTVKRFRVRKIVVS